MKREQLPNLVMFIPSGWRGKDVGCLGSPDVRTPNADALAAEGVAFSNCFAQSTIDTPSVCSFMTGWYPHVRGHRTKRHVLAPEEPFLLKQLKEQGYCVWWGGKNDVVRFEEEERVCSIRCRPDPGAVDLSRPPDMRPNDPLFDSDYRGKVADRSVVSTDEALVNGAIAFLESGLPTPFCICLTLSGPQAPLQAEIISKTDDALGRLTKVLKAAGHWDDTAVFVFSDHGEFAGDCRMAKTTPNSFGDDLTQVPLMVKYPVWIPVPKRDRPVDALVELVDFHATVTELARLPQRHTSFGKSLLPISLGLATEHSEQVFCEGEGLIGEPHILEARVAEDWPRFSAQYDDGETHGKSVMVRTRRWKYIKRLYERDELYDLAADPDELHNVADEPQHAGVRSDLLHRIARWYMATVDAVPYEPVMHKLQGRL